MLPSTSHQSQTPHTSLPPPPPPPPNQHGPPPNQHGSRIMKRDMSPSQPIKAMKQDLLRLPAPPSPISTKRTPKGALLPPPRRTNPAVWCAAFACVIFSILLILAGIATLIIYLVIKPKHPSFDTTSASLSSIYLDTPEFLNGDLTFLANFSNPNHKIDIRFEYVDIELYFFDTLIGKQSLQPFTQRREEARLESVHMISSEVYLPVNLSMELQKQVLRNRVQYNIRGTFRVRATLGLTHFSYWLYGRCQVELTGPPTGTLITRSCRTKR